MATARYPVGLESNATSGSDDGRAGDVPAGGDGIASAAALRGGHLAVSRAASLVGEQRVRAPMAAVAAGVMTVTLQADPDW